MPGNNLATNKTATEVTKKLNKNRFIDSYLLCLPAEASLIL
jgi:hypothetical protein